MLTTVSRVASIEPLEPPVDVGTPFPPVAFVTKATFAARPFWPAFLALPFGTLMIVAGGVALWRGSKVASRVAAGALGGASLGGFAASFPGDMIVMGFVLVVFACALALVLSTMKMLKKGRWAAGAFALAAALMFLYARTWFPSAPSL